MKEKEEKDVSLVFDTTNIASETYLMLFRANSQNISYGIVDSEKAEYYKNLIYEIKEKYKVQSFTLDGRFGVVYMLKRNFPDTPIQLCQLHFQRNIYKYTTRNPRTECGKELIKIVGRITKLTESRFSQLIESLEKDYDEFLSELNEKGKLVHGRLISAIRAAKRWKPYLFTYQKYPELKIPNTTNSCEGYFSQLKAKLNVHSGLSAQRRVQMAVSLISC